MSPPVASDLKYPGQRSGAIRQRKMNIAVKAAAADQENNEARRGEHERTWIGNIVRTGIGLAIIFIFLVVARLFERIK
jgi:hypothetical protein